MRRPKRVAALVAAVLCAAATGAPAARAEARTCSTSQACVVVEIFGADARLQSTSRFSSDQLDAFPEQTPAGSYEVRGPRSGSQNERIPPGVPIAEVISEAGARPSDVTYAYVSGSSSYQSPLDSSTHDFDAAGSNEFVDGLQPVIYPADDTLGYVRPLHGDGADTNNLDYFQSAPGGALTVEVHQSGALLRPELRASTTGVRVGQSVRLSASLTDPPAGESLDWTWELATGGSDIHTGSTPNLTTPPFTTPGTYYVRAGVTGSSGSSGESNTVAITVKSREKTPSPRTTGPGRGAGTSKNPIGGPVTGSGSRYNGRPGASSPTATGGPAVPTATDSRAPSTSAPSTSAPSAAGPTSSTSSSALARPSGDQFVAGFAIVQPGRASAASTPIDVSPAAAAAARAGGQHVRASLAWVGLACILALLLAGAGLERRRSTPGPLYGRKRRRHR